eukprot:JP444170.1.p2 GENE.JP444170.1~~JP444170.1.p2  ORF type:complete len:69 (-),score=14.34 JP444170.1:37-243(-)
MGAIREFTTGDDAVVRELLISDRGYQSPTTWINWEEVRHNLLSSLDCKIMLCKFVVAPPEEEEEEEED